MIQKNGNKFYKKKNSLNYKNLIEKVMIEGEFVE
jgi:hypothetical protein